MEQLDTVLYSSLRFGKHRHTSVADKAWETEMLKDTAELMECAPTAHLDSRTVVQIGSCFMSRAMILL